MPTISSPHNPFIKHLHKLGANGRYRRDCGETVLDGAHLLDACLASGRQPRRILVAEEARDDAEIAALLRRVHCPVDSCDADVFARASELKSPSGILALLALPEAAAGALPERSVWLDEVQDPGNVGSILRTAAAAGFQAAYLSPGCADAWSPRVLRAAMGAHFALDVVSGADLEELAEGRSGQILVTALTDSQDLYRARWTQERRAWLFGNEGAGVRPELARHATHRLRIPMPGAMESLNVGAAAAICLFEDVRRRLE